MMRLSTPGPSRFRQSKSLEVNYGGAEANVAISLVNFGLAAQHVTALPTNDWGEAIVNYLLENGVKTDFVKYYDESRLGIYYLEHGAGYRSPKVIYDRSNSAFTLLKAKNFAWEQIFNQAGWFHFTGITPAISQQAALACKQAVSLAKDMGIKISSDINYRRNLWKYGTEANKVMPGLISQCDLIVGAQVDIENCTSIKEQNFEAASRQLIKVYPSVKMVATTDRKVYSSTKQTISASLFTNNKIYKSKDYELDQITDRIGAGDAFMAGLIYSMLKGFTPDQAIEFATASCVLKHYIAGDANLVTADEVMDLLNGNTGKLKR